MEDGLTSTKIFGLISSWGLTWPKMFGIIFPWGLNYPGGISWPRRTILAKNIISNPWASRSKYILQSKSKRSYSSIPNFAANSIKKPLPMDLSNPEREK